MRKCVTGVERVCKKCATIDPQGTRAGDRFERAGLTAAGIATKAECPDPADFTAPV